MRWSWAAVELPHALLRRQQSALSWLAALVACSAVFAGPTSEYSGADEGALFDRASFSYGAPRFTSHSGAQGWATSGPDVRRSSAEGVTAEDDGAGTGGWHFIAPRRVVSLRSRLLGSCITYTLACLNSTTQDPTSGDAGQHEADESDLVLSGAGLQLGAVGEMRAGQAGPRHDDDARDQIMLVRIHVAQRWIDTATGLVVETQALERVLASLDALLLRPRAFSGVRMHGPVTLRGFIISKSCDMQRLISANCPAPPEPFRHHHQQQPTPDPNSTTTPNSSPHPTPSGEGGEMASVQSVKGGRGAGLDGCDEEYEKRRWKEALECYSRVFASALSPLHDPRSHHQQGHHVHDIRKWLGQWCGERVCWGVLRGTRYVCYLCILLLPACLSVYWNMMDGCLVVFDCYSPTAVQVFSPLS